MILEKNSRLVMAGDSVTDCGRNRELPDCFWSTWGDGYVHVVYSNLLAFAPESNIMVINKGVSGDTSRDLLARWESDVMAAHPDYISVMIGINDVWRHFDSVVRQENLVTIDEFRENLELIAEKSRGVKKLFFITPVFWANTEDEPMFKMKRNFDAMIKSVSEKVGAVFIDAQSAADKVLKSQSHYMFTTDHVHPNLPGHTIIAETFLRAIKLERT